jgi:hypothetical protein
MDSTNIVTTVSHATPEQVTQQFNAWMAVAALIGGVLWHMLLKVWPVLQKIYPYVVANGGIFQIIGKFFWNTPKPSTAGQYFFPEPPAPQPPKTGV